MAPKGKKASTAKAKAKAAAATKIRARAVSKAGSQSSAALAPSLDEGAGTPQQGVFTASAKQQALIDAAVKRLLRLKFSHIHAAKLKATVNGQGETVEQVAAEEVRRTTLVDKYQK